MLSPIWRVCAMQFPVHHAHACALTHTLHAWQLNYTWNMAVCLLSRSLSSHTLIHYHNVNRERSIMLWNNSVLNFWHKIRILNVIGKRTRVLWIWLVCASVESITQSDNHHHLLGMHMHPPVCNEEATLICLNVKHWFIQRREEAATRNGGICILFKNLRHRSGVCHLCWP